MPLAKNFAPNNKTVYTELKCMIKGGALPPFILKENLEQPFIQLANDLALPLPETMLARGAGVIQQ